MSLRAIWDILCFIIKATSKNWFASDLWNFTSRDVPRRVFTIYLTHHSGLCDSKRNRKIPRKKRQPRKSSFCNQFNFLERGIFRSCLKHLGQFLGSFFIQIKDRIIGKTYCKCFFFAATHIAISKDI